MNKIELVELSKADRIWITYQIKSSKLSEQTKENMIIKLQKVIQFPTKDELKELGDTICKDRFHGEILVKRFYTN